MRAEGTLLLTRRDVADLLDLDDCIAAVEEAFRLEGEERTPRPGILSYPVGRGGFHIKMAALSLSRPYFAAKVNGNFSANPERFGLPAIQGVIVLCDAENGYPLALMDSIEITILRTGAATAVAAKFLARPDSTVVTICGCGNQGRVQLRALARVLPIEKVFAYDARAEAAEIFARDMASLGVEIVVVAEPGRAVRSSDVCVTCTPSRRPFLRRGEISPGSFLAAVGADAAEKGELDPALLASAMLVVDSLEQCATIGELHHALEEGLLARSAVHAELSEIVAGKRPGRRSPEEIAIFDSTGTALEDAAAAALVYERAVRAGRGVVLDLESRSAS